MACTGVGDAIVSAQVLLWRRHLRANPVACNAVGVICLVHYARGAAGAEDVSARFWAETKEGLRKKKINGRAVPLSAAHGGVSLSVNRHLLLHFPWYCTSRSGWPLHFAFNSAHSSL